MTIEICPSLVKSLTTMKHILLDWTFRTSNGSTSLVLLWKTFSKTSTIKTLILLKIHIFIINY